MAKQKFDFIQPIKDIPAAIKGFPKNFIHMWKDPVKSIADVDQRKKEVMPFLYLSIAITLLFAGLSNIPHLGFLMIFGLVGMVGIGACALMLFVGNKAKKRFECLTCNNCKKLPEIDSKEVFDQLVSYKLIDEKINSSVGNDASKDGKVNVYAEAYSLASFSITLKCPYCGTEKKLVYTTKVFECRISQKTLVNQMEIVKINLESKLKPVLDVYNSDDRNKIPYSIHSIHNPNYENRGKLQFNSPATYNGVSIKYHKSLDEVVESYFYRNQLDGNLKEIQS